MKHIKLFEGFYYDRIAEVEKELSNHMKNDLANWINEFKDELDDVHSTDPWYYSDEKVMISELVINFKNKEMTREDLEFIEKTYNSMVDTLKSDYKIYITYDSKNTYDQYTKSLNFAEITNKKMRKIERITIEFRGK
jgi:hypothetical protein